MSIKTGLYQGTQLKQEMKINPRLYQAMDLLYMPLLDLQQHLKQELLNNPFLDMVEPDEDEEDEGEVQEEAANPEAEPEKDEKGEIDWEEILLDGFDAGGRREEHEEREYYEPVTVDSRDLSDHLRDQVTLLDLTPRQMYLAEEFIGNINEDGYLACGLDKIVEGVNESVQKVAEEAEREVTDLPMYTIPEAEEMLGVIQSLDPPGVGARDLRECLLIQLKREGKQNSLEYKIISEHMQDLGKRRFPEIARKMGLSVEQVQKCANNIAQLDPRPGQIFADLPQNYVLPDVTVEKIDGEYQVILNGEQIPHLRISNTYKDIMSHDGNGSEVKDYIRDKIRSGKFLIKSIHQRQQTISNIAHEIVKRQREFLEQGSAHLKPMTMVQIADVVGVHETTVSRAISGKYISTPQGVFEMKYFFTPGYQTSSGEAMSNTSVKEAIDDLVTNEDGSTPLSDKEIVEILSDRGIPIARRTVAKYRTELNILPSNMRRKY